MIAFVKDILIYMVIAVAIIYLPLQFGGWARHLRRRRRPRWPRRRPPTRQSRPGSFIPGPAQHWAYASLALGSAMALFMYPHCVTAALSSKDRSTGPPQRRHPAGVLAAARPAGAARLRRDQGRHQADRAGRQGRTRSWSIPQLFEDHFPSWFTGVAFGAIAIGALVPAAIMSIAAANLFTRNIYKALPEARRHRRPGGEGLQDRLADHQVRRAAVRARRWTSRTR